MPSLQWLMVQADLDPIAGSEQGGQRPVLVVSNETFNQVMPNVAVLPLTSTRRRLYPHEVLIPAGRAGQPLDSIAMAYQIRTVSKHRLGTSYGHLDDDALRAGIQQAIREYLDLI